MKRKKKKKKKNYVRKNYVIINAGNTAYLISYLSFTFEHLKHLQC